MRRLTIYTIALFISFSGFCQSDTSYYYTVSETKELVIKVTDNDPSLIPNFFVGTGVTAGTRPLNNLDFLVPAQVDIGFNRFSAALRADIPVIARFDSQYDQLVDNENLQTTNRFFISTPLELVCDYSFLDSIKNSPVRLRSSPILIGDRDTIIKAEIIGNVHYSSSIRLGYLFNQSILNSAYLTSGLVSNSGEVFTNSGSGTVFNNNVENIYHTNYRAHSVFIGFNRKKKYHINYMENDSSIQRSRIYSIYADFIYAPVFTIEEMNVRDFESGDVSTYDVDHTNGFIPRPFGFRVGADLSFPVTMRSSFTFQFETGVRPGISNINSNDNFIGEVLFFQNRVLYRFGTKL